MGSRITAFFLIIIVLLLNGCVAVSKRQEWTWRKMKSETTSTPDVAFIEINLTKAKTFLPTPLILTEINYSKDYLLALDFHTDTSSVYQRLDSIRYAVSRPDGKLVSAGVLPILQGEVSIRPYSPGIYRAQATTAPRIRLGRQRQPLSGSFVIYATDRHNQPQSIRINDAPLHYYRPRIVSFL